MYGVNAVRSAVIWRGKNDLAFAQDILLLKESYIAMIVKYFPQTTVHTNTSEMIRVLI